MTKAVCLCASLKARLAAGGFRAQVHSVFEHTINLTAPFGLLALLTEQKPLQPYSIRLNGGLPRWDRSPLSFSPDGAFCGTGAALLDFSDAAAVDLTLPRSSPLSPVTATALAAEITAFLRQSPVEESLDSFVLWGKGNYFTAFLAPRLSAFRRAASSGRELPEAAAAMAGCGVGLTPSSDDLLCGYLAAAFAFGRLSPALLRETCEAAAAKTTDISGAILRQLGEGLVSTPVLHFTEALLGGRAPVALLQQVSDLGSTSGRDSLTGICLSLFDMGGEAV